MNVTVDISGAFIRRFSRRELESFVIRCLREIGGKRRYQEVSIAFVDDLEMTRLNGRFRRKQRTTDVLTFPGEHEEGSLGDIVISIDQAKRQARDERHSLPTEVRYLLVHGLIHAHGYDHETDAGEMNSLEVKVRKRVGL
ncbi:MAG TPA: rRNA maturation RNase YbeY [Thermoanaerobaculia bacterium]|nr:rRNA maturation RNase YbeY [Thermoanaerobaculia bacterium]